MGSWSVYCGISNISITSGDECVLLPIRKNKGERDYQPYLPATLPIFGKYNDYGGMECIIEDDNTKLIEEHFGVTIDDFVCLFVDGNLTYNREEASEIKSRIKNYEELKNLDFMWINREVYNFMSSRCPGFGGEGHLDMGNHELLILLGCVYGGKVGNLGYNKLYTFENTNLYSNGSSLRSVDDKGIYYFDNDHNSLSNYITIPETKKWIGNKSMWQLWEYLNDKEAKKRLLTILGYKYDSFDDYHLLINARLVKEGIITQEECDKLNEEASQPSGETLLDKYTTNFKLLGDMLSDLNSFRFNLYCMSGTFKPYILYVTPQCGEYELHQIFLEEFSRINKSQIEKI